jgi:hypothetical protein
MKKKKLLLDKRMVQTKSKTQMQEASNVSFNELNNSVSSSSFFLMVYSRLLPLQLLKEILIHKKQPLLMTLNLILPTCVLPGKQRENV